MSMLDPPRLGEMKSYIPSSVLTNFPVHWLKTKNKMTRIPNNRKAARQKKISQLLSKASSITLKLQQLSNDLDSSSVVHKVKINVNSVNGLIKYSNLGRNAVHL